MDEYTEREERIVEMFLNGEVDLKEATRQYYARDSATQHEIRYTDDGSVRIFLLPAGGGWTPHFEEGWFEAYDANKEIVLCLPLTSIISIVRRAV